MVRPFRSQSDTGPVIEPEPALLSLLLRDFQPLTPPDPFDTLMVHLPASVPEQRSHASVAITTILTRQFDDVLGQSGFIGTPLWNLALGRTVLAERAAGAALGNPKRLPHMVDAFPAARRAQKFPRAASDKIILSSVRSETAFRSRWFSFSNSFNRFS